MEGMLLSLTVAGAVEASHLFPEHLAAGVSYPDGRPVRTARSCSTCRTAPYCLTQRGFCNIVRTVEADFNSLEAKVAQFVSLCERLRAENNVLKQQLAAARVDAKRLLEKIDGAKARLEGLLSKIPG
jgi:cell division protein ZapB